MPNWSCNKIYFRNDEEFNKAKSLLIAITAKGEEIITFNRLVPQPDSLKISAGGIIKIVDDHQNFEELEETYKRTIEIQINRIKGKFENCNYTLVPDFEETITLTSKDAKDYFNKMKRIIEFNKANYKAKGWYDWRLKHWGTIDDAKYTRIDKKEKSIYFETLWESPKQLLETLSNRIPHSPILVMSTDENSYDLESCIFFNGKCKNYEFADNNYRYSREKFMLEKTGEAREIPEELEGEYHKRRIEKCDKKYERRKNILLKEMNNFPPVERKISLDINKAEAKLMKYSLNYFFDHLENEQLSTLMASGFSKNELLELNYSEEEIKETLDEIIIKKDTSFGLYSMCYRAMKLEEANESDNYILDFLSERNFDVSVFSGKSVKEISIDKVFDYLGYKDVLDDAKKILVKEKEMLNKKEGAMTNE